MTTATQTEIKQDKYADIHTIPFMTHLLDNMNMSVHSALLYSYLYHAGVDDKAFVEITEDQIYNNIGLRGKSLRKARKGLLSDGYIAFARSVRDDGDGEYVLISASKRLS